MSRHFLLLWFLPVASAQIYLNLGFEGGSGSHPVNWIRSGLEYDIQEDPTVAYAGLQSMRIRNVVFPPQFPGVFRQHFPVEEARGKHLRFSGYLKTEGVTSKPAGLYMTIYGDNGRSILSNDSTSKGAPQGTSNWLQVVIDRDVSPLAEIIDFGATLGGNGTAYFDELKIEIDGVPYPQGADALGRPPTMEETGWLLKNSIHFAHANPSSGPLARERPKPGNGGLPAGSGYFADLAPVKELVGNAHIIGIGESSHGAHEFFQMKHRMLEFLASEVGVTIFAIEANMPEAYRVNDYVLTGKGDPRELLKGMYFWTWNTQEVLDMILWMRAYNASGRGPLQFTGFDLQYAPVAMDNVRAFVTKADASYLSQLNTIYTQVTAAQNVDGTTSTTAMATVLSAVAAAHQVVQYLDAHRGQYSANFSAADIEWIVQNARVVEQATFGRTGDPYFRDRAMAENAEWIFRQAPPGSKMMLWAHDGHIQKQAGFMGSYVNDVHGSDYVAIAQLFYEGQYNARVDNGQSLVPPVMLNTADPSEPGSVEYAFHASGAPRLMLDLRKASPAKPESAWLLGGLQFRSIGAFSKANSFTVSWSFAHDYDAVIFFDRVRGSELLPF